MWVTAEQQLEFDRQYEGFSSFDVWADQEIDALRWHSRTDDLCALRAATGEATWREAVENVARAGELNVSLLPEGHQRPPVRLTDTQASWAQAAIMGGRAGVKALYKAEADVRALVFGLATRGSPIDVETIRELHREATRGQEEFVIADSDGSAGFLSLPSGEYKSHPNYGLGADGTIFPFAPVDRTSTEVASLVAVLASPSFESAHPVLGAAYALDSLLRIHPFADANGRVARALASVYQCKAIGVPLIVSVEHRVQYLEAVVSRKDKNRQLLVDFVFERTMEAIDGVRICLSTTLGRRRTHPFQPLGGMVMPKVDDDGQPVSDDPAQEDESLAGGKGRGQFVDAHSGPAGEHSSIETDPNNPRETARAGSADDGGNDPSGSNATGGV